MKVGVLVKQAPSALLTLSPNMTNAVAPTPTTWKAN